MTYINFKHYIKFAQNQQNMNLLTLILISLLSLELNFKSLPIEDCGINVATICQDSLGNMWFGGFEGVIRYDGNRYTRFKPDIRSGEQFPDMPAYRILCDSNGQICVGHVSGLSIYDNSTNTFKNFISPNGPVTHITELYPEHYLTIVGKRLMIFNEEGGKFTKENLPSSLVSLRATSLCSYNDTIYIGTEDGKCFSTDRLLKNVTHLTDIPECQINCILPDSHGHLWIGTENSGLWDIDLYENSCERVNGLGESKSTKIIKSLNIDNEGNLWIGSKNGLSILKDGKIFNFRHDNAQPGSIPHDSIGDIYVDWQGTMWLGTYYGGACYYTPHSSQFTCIPSSTNKRNLQGNIISDIVEDMDGSLWIGTNSGGLNHLCTDGRFEHISHIDQSNSQVDIKCIYVSPYSGTIYVAADRSRLMKVDRKKLKLVPTGLETPESCYAIEQNQDNTFYIGAIDGLYEYDEISGSISRMYISGDISNIKSLKLDSRGVLWIGKKSGITAIQKKSGNIIELPRELSAIRYAEAIMEDSAGRIWIGSRDGLFSYDVQTGEVVDYSERNGFPEQVIHGIEEDSNGIFWISTDNGLVRLDPKSGNKWTFTTADGLLDNRFTTYANCYTKGGIMYFGSLHGVIYFDPDKINMTRKSVLPIICGLEANGIWKGIPKERIILRPNERDISIFFSSPDYISGKNGKFYYKLNGLESEWQSVNTDWRAMYHDLAHGEYTFMLRHVDSSGTDVQNIESLRIRISPHWYETLAFRLFLIISLFGGVIFLISWQLTKKDKKHKIQMDKLRSDLLRDFSLEFVGIGANKSASKENIPVSFDMSDEKFMRKTMKVIKENLANSNFSVDDLSVNIGMSRTNVNLKVKALFGTSPLELIKTVRFNEACRLLHEKKHSIAEISDMVGFATPSYFAAAFKRFIGCTPSEYLKKNQ